VRRPKADAAIRQPWSSAVFLDRHGPAVLRVRGLATIKERLFLAPG